MAIGNIFQIATAFRFEVGSAIASTAKLGAKVDGLNEKIGNVQQSFKYLSIGLASQLTTGQAGLIGFLKNATSASEELYKSQTRLGQIIKVNADKFKGMEGISPFRVGGDLTKKIARLGFERGLDPDEMVYMASAILPQLIGAGATGTNFDKALSLVGGISSVGGVLGMNPANAMGSLQGLIEGWNIGGNNPVWRALTQKSPDMKKYGQNPDAWRRLKTAERVEKLSKAFEKLAGDSTFLNRQLNTMTAQWTRLKSLFSGMNSILAPFGDVLRKRVIPILSKLNELIDKRLRVAVKRLAPLIDNFIGSWDNAYLQFKKLSTLGKSLNFAHTASMWAYILTHLKGFILWASKHMLKLGGIFAIVGAKATGLTMKFLKFTAFFKIFGKILSLVIGGLVSYAKWSAVFFIISRGWERVKARIRLNFIRNFLQNVVGISTDLGTALKQLYQAIHPIVSLFGWLADNLADGLVSFGKWIGGFFLSFNKLFGSETEKSMTFLEGFKQVMVVFTNWIKAFFITLGGHMKALGSIFKSIGAHIINFIKLLKDFALAPFKSDVSLVGSWKDYRTRGREINKLAKDDISGVYNNLYPGGSIFKGGWLASGSVMDKLMAKHFKDITKDQFGKPPEYKITNHNKVTMNQNFPETFQPDRVAISIVDALEKGVMAQTTDGVRRLQTRAIAGD